MTDLRDRFQALDDLRAPDLWREIQGRAAAVPQRAVRGVPWALVGALLVALAAGGAALIGSGVLKPRLPVQPLSTWIRTGTLNEARYGQTAVLLRDGRVLVMGGIGERPGGWETASAELYDPDTGNWTPTGSMTQARLPGHTATLLLDGRVLVVGWGPNADLYDPAKGTWTATGAMVEQQRGDHTATLLPDGKVLVAGGGGEGVASAELYDPATGTWTATASMATERTGHTATLLPDGNVLVAGGHTVHLGLVSPTDSAELYDPATRTWSATGSMSAASPVLVSGLTATLLPDDTVLLIGQTAGSETWADRYDPAAGTWTGAPARNWPADPMHVPVTATLLPDGQVLVVGFDGSAAELDPARGTWTRVPSMLDVEAGPRHTATLLADGRLLVVGGGGSNDPERGIKYPAELFGPAPATTSPGPSASLLVTDGAWTTVGILGTGRVGHSATLLSDGRVLVAGGNRVSGGSLGVTRPLEEATAEIFDPTGRPAFTPTASMVTGRTRHTATLLPNGQVLVAGGSGEAGTLDSAELFDSATGVWRATGSMVTSREGHAAVLLESGLVLVVGGVMDGVAALDSAELYDTETGTWTPTGRMVNARWGFTATLLEDGRVLVAGGRVLVAGGSGGLRDLATAEIYNPTSGSWSAAAPPPEPLLGHSATLLVDGSVLVVGGWHSGNGTIENRVLLYDPAGDTWTRVADLPEARGGHTATLLGDGRVLVVGGLGNGPEVACGPVANSAVLYDPAARAWTPAGALSVARYQQVATRLRDGSVLITGGARNICQNNAVDLAELYGADSGK